ncbi:MAG: 2-deoxy-scyllo-inosamine dehydrogenase [Planctomycetes bacterium]|nr:2-deoxy-scyllo-inosamine dehydrogenase [Planctomycetota bacterium]
MKAIVARGGEARFVADHPEPRPEAGEALVQVTRAGVCATDLQLLRGYKGGFEGVMGHEFAGVVIDGGPRPELRRRRVVGEINLPCRACATCMAGRGNHCPSRRVLGILGRDGVFAERVAVPAANLHAVPDGVGDDAAAFAEPLAAAYRAVEAWDGEGRVVVVGDGRLGLLCAMAFAASGARTTLVGRHEAKLARAAERGITTAMASEGLAGADLVVEATGSPSGLRDALAIVRPMGTLVLKTTCGDADAPRPFDWNRVVVDEIRIVGSRCGPFPRALGALASGAVDVRPLVTARFPLARGADALTAAADRRQVKVLIETE